MIILINDDNKNLHQQELDQIHVLRHRVFVEQLKWEGVTSRDGREYDQFDGSGTSYLAVMDGASVAATIRLNWSDKPTLMSEVFMHLVQFEKLPVGPTTVDLSRLAISPDYANTNRMNLYGSDMLCALLEYGLTEHLTEYTAISSTQLLSSLLQWGIRVYPLGFPAGEGVGEHVAIRLPITEEALLRLYQFTGNYKPRFREVRFAEAFEPLTAGQTAA